jgi:hypothetical protein
MLQCVWSLIKNDGDFFFYNIFHTSNPRQISDWSDQGRLSVVPTESRESHARKSEKEVSLNIKSL